MGLLTEAVIPWERGLLRRYRWQRSYMLCDWLHPSAEAVTTITTTTCTAQTVAPADEQFVTIRSRTSGICALQADGISACWGARKKLGYPNSPAWRKVQRQLCTGRHTYALRLTGPQSTGERLPQRCTSPGIFDAPSRMVYCTFLSP